MDFLRKLKEKVTRSRPRRRGGLSRSAQRAQNLEFGQVHNPLSGFQRLTNHRLIALWCELELRDREINTSLQQRDVEIDTQMARLTRLLEALDRRYSLLDVHYQSHDIEFDLLERRVKNLLEKFELNMKEKQLENDAKVKELVKRIEELEGNVYKLAKECRIHQEILRGHDEDLIDHEVCLGKLEELAGITHEVAVKAGEEVTDEVEEEADKEVPAVTDEEVKALASAMM